VEQLDGHGRGIRQVRLAISARPGHGQTQARSDPSPAWKHGVANRFGQAGRAWRRGGFRDDLIERSLDSGIRFHGLSK
jgi:hypothetical protein